MDAATPTTGSFGLDLTSPMSTTNRCRDLILWRPQPYFVPPSNYTVPTPTFHSFGKLPAELRTKIWKLCLPGPRLVDFQLKGQLFKCAASSEPVPVILHINHESRVEGLKQYKLISIIPPAKFGGVCVINPKLSDDHKVRVLPHTRPRIAFDNTRDAVILMRILSPPTVILFEEKGPDRSLALQSCFDYEDVVLPWGLTGNLPRLDELDSGDFEDITDAMSQLRSARKVTLCLFCYEGRNLIPIEEQPDTFKNGLLNHWDNLTARATSDFPDFLDPAKNFDLEIKMWYEFPKNQIPVIKAAMANRGRYNQIEGRRRLRDFRRAIRVYQKTGTSPEWWVYDISRYNSTRNREEARIPLVSLLPWHESENGSSR